MSGSWPSGHGTRTRMTVRVARSTTVVSSSVEDRTSRWSVDPPAVGHPLLAPGRAAEEARRVGRRRGGAAPWATSPSRSVCGGPWRRPCRSDRCPGLVGSTSTSSSRPCPVAAASAVGPVRHRCRRPGPRRRAHPTSASSWPARVAASAAGVGTSGPADVRQPGLGRAPLEERAVVGLTPGDDGGGEPVPPHLGEQVGPVPGHHDLVAPAPHGRARPPGRRAPPGCRSSSGRARATVRSTASSQPRVVGERVGPQQRGDGDGVGGRDGPVEELLGSDDQRLGVARRS